MTAADAKNMMPINAPPDGKLVEAVLKQWYVVIRKAAEANESKVKESEVSKLRTPVPDAVHQEVHRQLMRDGFKVRRDRGDEITVSW